MRLDFVGWQKHVKPQSQGCLRSSQDPQLTIIDRRSNHLQKCGRTFRFVSDSRTVFYKEPGCDAIVLEAC